MDCRTTGTRNFAVGSQALLLNNNGAQNTAIGYDALRYHCFTYIILYPIHVNTKLKVATYACFHHDQKCENTDYFYMFISNQTVLVDLNYFRIMKDTADQMIQDYNNYFDKWLWFYKFVKRDVESMDIFKDLILIHYINLRLPDKCVI